MSRLHLILKVSNVIVYLWFLSATVYSVFGPDPSKDVTRQHLTYITPAYWVNYAWSAVHTLLGGFIIYQWFEPASDGTVHGVGWHFVISTILNSIWFSLWNNGYLIPSFIAILFTASSVSFVFYNLERNYPANNWWDRLFIHAPFSIWHGFITLISVENLFAIFTSIPESDPDALRPDLLHVILAVIALLFLSSTAIGYVEFKNKKGDVVGALVIAYGLFAIFAEQQSSVIHWTALGLGILTVLYPTRPYVFKLLGRTNDPATAPLLG
jgi:hypothetical protein